MGKFSENFEKWAEKINNSKNSLELAEVMSKLMKEIEKYIKNREFDESDKEVEIMLNRLADEKQQTFKNIETKRAWEERKNENLQQFMKKERIPIFGSFLTRGKRKAGVIIYREGNRKARRIAEEILHEFKDYISRIESSARYRFFPTPKERRPVLEINLIYNQVDSVVITNIISKIRDEGFNLIRSEPFINQNIYILQFEEQADIEKLMKKYKVDIIRPETEEEKRKRAEEIESYYSGPTTPGKFPKPSMKDKIKHLFLSRKINKMPNKEDFEDLEKRIQQALENREGKETTLIEALTMLNTAKEYLKTGDVEETTKYFKDAENLFHESIKEQDKEYKIIEKGYKKKMPFWERGIRRHKLKQTPRKIYEGKPSENVEKYAKIILPIAAIFIGIIILTLLPGLWIIGIPAIIIGIGYLLIVAPEMDKFSFKQKIGVLITITGGLLAFVFGVIWYGLALLFLGGAFILYDWIPKRKGRLAIKIIELGATLALLILVVPAFLNWAGISISLGALALFSGLNTFLLFLLWSWSEGKSIKESLEEELLKKQIEEIEARKKAEEAQADNEKKEEKNEKEKNKIKCPMCGKEVDHLVPGYGVCEECLAKSYSEEKQKEGEQK